MDQNELETAIECHQAMTGSINMHMTFDLSELKERHFNRPGSSITQIHRQLVALVTFGDVCRLCTAALISTVLITQTPCGSVHSPVHTLVQIPESRFYRDPFTEGTSSAGVHSLFPLQ